MEFISGLKNSRGALVILVLAVLSQNAVAATDGTELAALKSFRYNIGDPMNRLSDWKGDDPCGSNWTGVVCSSDADQVQHVVELRLLNMNLTGNLAPDLGNLTHLNILDVMWNNISGSIPSEIGNLQNLTLLLLNGNNLTGSLPESLGNLKNLNRIQIDQNQISGPVPTSFQYLNNAQHFHMNNNSLNGSIPSELGRMKSLLHLLLDNNNLSGQLPPELSNISTLLILQLDNNHFDGSIPSNYSNMVNLTKMSLRNCSLSGTIPDLTKLSNLGYLDLSHNNLNDTLPSGKLSDNITTIDLSYNHLDGNFSSSLSELPNLQYLSLMNNSLDGTVPAGLHDHVIFSRPSSRLILDFRYNNFSNNNYKNYPANVTFLLYGNPACDGSTDAECTTDNFSIVNISSIALTTSVTSGLTCPEHTCSSYYNQEYIYGLETDGFCVCATPLEVGYRLKSPGFAYFPPYVNGFEIYLSSGLKLSQYQVNISSYIWESGPRLAMILKLFPSNNSNQYQFSDEEVSSLYKTFTNWKIPDNNTFGPYEVLNFTIPFPYNLTLSAGSSSSSLSNGAIVGIVLGCVALTAVVLLIIMFFLWKRQRRYTAFSSKKPARNVHHEHIKVAGVKDFTFQEMALATNDFNSSMQIGQGGYGKVYKGVLVDGQIVAIKRAKEGSLQGSLEFYTEIELLSRVHHRNLVSLVGYCDDDGEQMLVYEYMANGTLHDNLSSFSKKPLDFHTRLQIALGSARGILYLHTEANPPIYHRDIKASNILLDEKKIAKVADFGLSKLAPISDMEGMAPSHVSTVVKGTPGYLDPEYFLTHKLTDKSDVYSFGVVLLEIVTGMQPISHGKNLVREVNLAYEAGMMLSIVDPRMGSYPSECLGPLVKMAISCCKDNTDSRPSMAEVVRDLDEIYKMTPWSDSAVSLEGSEVELNDMKGLKMHFPSNPYMSSEIEGSDLMSGTIPNIAPR